MLLYCPQVGGSQICRPLAFQRTAPLCQGPHVSRTEDAYTHSTLGSSGSIQGASCCQIRSIRLPNCFFQEYKGTGALSGPLLRGLPAAPPPCPLPVAPHKLLLLLLLLRFPPCSPPTTLRLSFFAALACTAKCFIQDGWMAGSQQSPHCLSSLEVWSAVVPPLRTTTKTYKN